jgi:hypothetical protein
LTTELSSLTATPSPVRTFNTAPGSTSTVTPVLPGMATSGVAEGFGELVSHVAVWPLAGVGLSQAASADGVRNRHVMPIDSGHNHVGGDGERVRRIFFSLHVSAGKVR